MADTGPPKVVADERETLLVMLDYLRESVIRKLEGLDAPAVRQRLVESQTNLIGLVQHLAFAEAIWMVTVFAGSDDPAPDGSMDVDVDLTTHGVIERYRIQGLMTRRIATAATLDQLAARPAHGDEPVSLRWILVHLVEETARHAGHADILRELLDGRRGR